MLPCMVRRRSNSSGRNTDKATIDQECRPRRANLKSLKVSWFHGCIESLSRWLWGDFWVDVMREDVACGYRVNILSHFSIGHLFGWPLCFKHPNAESLPSLESGCSLIPGYQLSANTHTLRLHFWGPWQNYWGQFDIIGSFYCNVHVMIVHESQWCPMAIHVRPWLHLLRRSTFRYDLGI